MTPDPRPPKRLKDPGLMKKLHQELQGEPCTLCGVRVGTQLDHVTLRSQGGNDTRQNLRWVCAECHLGRHGGF